MRDLAGVWKWVAGICVAVWSLFLVYTALTVAFHPVLQGSISLAFGLVLVFIAYPVHPAVQSRASGSPAGRFLLGTPRGPGALDLVLAAVSLIPCIYLMWNWEDLVRRPGIYEPFHIVLSVVLAVGLLEGTRRALGFVIPLLVLLFILYGLLGSWIPGGFGHAGFGLEEIFYQFYLMTEGIWGLLTDLTSRLIALFVIFGPVLFATGVGKTFLDLAKVSGGRLRGGAGHIATISSAFFGMLSGSAVANVATTGAFTIPTMKRLGFRADTAGAIEAAASSGGQIMPPIMGAGAFVMAEMLGISYVSVMIAGTIPAVIYFAGILAGVWVEAGRRGIQKMPADQIPPLREVFAPRQILVFMIPVGLLVYLLVRLYPAQFAAAWAILAAMAVFLLMGPLRRGDVWERLKTIGRGYYTAVLSSLAWLMVMMSCVQMAVTMISLTGFGVKVSELILALSGTSRALALLATMLTAIILGMGMTTTAAYVIAAAVLAPALAQLGVPDLAGHLFIFYFAIKSGLTPPVCIAVFTATAISGGNWLRTAWDAMRLGIGGYIVPFYFIYNPALLMRGSPLHIVVAVASATVAMFAIEAGVMGFLRRPATLLERALYVAGGLFLLDPNPFTDLLGLGVAGLGYLSERANFSPRLLGGRPTG
ncbi:MAG: TRAP transporter fused permease subunit [Candidatus Tectomicrobia bacterium]|nr:TRAP transporter fused permease subunit [Candidatus Tectomicrobia bacterium]